MTQEYFNQGFSYLYQDDRFEGFTPPATTDGSYRGRMKKAKATKEYLQGLFDDKLLEVKERLKASNCKVGLRVQGGAIVLQATLPPKPGSDRQKAYQQQISLGIPANLDGLKTAEEESYELGKLIARKQFEWSEKYLGRRCDEQIRTIKYYYDLLEDEYFKSRKRTPQSEHTLSYYFDHLKLYVGLDTECSQKALEQKINTLSGNAKYAAIKVIRILASIFQLNLEFKQDKQNKNTNERTIPSEKEIVESYSFFEKYSQERSSTGQKKYEHTWIMWRWVYGMLATYGLRPRELFTKPDFEWFLSPENTKSTFKVHRENKTGAREVFPFVPEWVELFDLKHLQAIKMLQELLIDKHTFKQINAVRVCNSSWFRRVGIDFDPYDLRHACAIRAHMQGIPAKASADNLGHTIEIHNEVYQRWFGKRNREIAFDTAARKKSEVEELREEIQRLTVENERLQLELDYAKSFLSEIQLSQK